MIQRIQSVYLILAIAISLVLPFAVSLWKEGEAQVFAQDQPIALGLFLTSGLISVIALLRFKNRMSQFILGRINIILNFILLIVLVIVSQNSSGGDIDPEKGVGLGMFLPIISIVLLVLANKAIKKDEDLVKSVDRLR